MSVGCRCKEDQVDGDEDSDSRSSARQPGPVG